MRSSSRITARAALCGALAAGLLLAGCSDNDRLPSKPQHDHDHVDSRGRLVFAQAEPARVHVYDLDAERSLQSFELDHPASGIQASPGGRYAVVLQRNHHQTRFVDGGLWSEDHGDHRHDYREAPLMLAYTLPGSRPTHYSSHGGLAALFLDGQPATETAAAQPAGVRVFSDASLGASGGPGLEATLDLPVNMHGTAEPRGQWLLATHRDPEASGTLPDRVELYRREGSGYAFSQRFDLACPGLHGSSSNAGYTLFGCTDGVLVIEQTGDSFSARKIANPASLTGGARIGTVVGHEALPDFGGFAGSDFYAIDPAAGTMTRVDWAGASAATKVAHAMDAHGENFLILDNSGTLQVLDPLDGWKTRGSVKVLDSVPAGQTPALAASRAADEVYIADPAAGGLVVVDLEALQVKRRIPLGFAPVGLAWLGFGAHAH